MGKMGKFSVKGLKELQKGLNKLQREELDAFIESCAKELAGRLLAKVIKRTPVGQYDKPVSFIADIPEKKVEFTTKSGKEVKFTAKARKKQVNFQPKTGKKGGTLRRGWTANPMTINHVGDKYVVEITNPVEYASYVEFGHRTANHTGWVKGQFMLTISEQEIEGIAPKVLEGKVKKLLKGCMK